MCLALLRGGDRCALRQTGTDLRVPRRTGGDVVVHSHGVVSCVHHWAVLDRGFVTEYDESRSLFMKYRL